MAILKNQKFVHVVTIELQKKTGHYEICKVCFWEDDGNIELTKYSGVNRMTLNEGKEKFKQFKDIYGNNLNQDETILKYEMGNVEKVGEE